MAQPTTKKVEVKAEEQQMAENAKAAVIYMRNFITTGSKQNADRFLALWDENGSNDFFLRGFVKEMDRHPEITRLFQAYKKGTGKENVYPEDIITAVEACYEELRKPKGEQDRGRLQQFGSSFVSEMKKIVMRYGVPRVVVVPPRYDDKILAHFIKVFSVAVKEEASREDRMKALMKTVVDRFAVGSFEEGAHMTKGILDCYLRLDKDERKDFDEWLVQLSAKQKNELVGQVQAVIKQRRLRVPKEVVELAFARWQETKELKKEKMTKEELELEDYPPHIKEKDITEMISDLEKNPLGYTLEKMQMRLEYLRKKRKALGRKTDEKSKKEVQAIFKEFDATQEWLKKIGIETETAEEGVASLWAGMRYISALYSDLKFDDILRSLESISSKKTLFDMYKKYLSSIDSSVARFFADIKPEDPRYLELVRARIAERVTAENVSSGLSAWFDYFKHFAPDRPLSQGGQVESVEGQMINRISNLGALGHLAVLEYSRAVTEAGVAGGMEKRTIPTETVVEREAAGEVEKRLVVQTVTRLYALHPLLVVEYFSAMTNVARICEDNPDAYRKALETVLAMVSSSTDPIVSRFSPTQMTTTNARLVIQRLERAFEQIMKLEKSKLTQYDRLNLWDDTLLLRQYPPHIIEQRPPGYAPRMLVDQEWGRGFYPPSPFPVYLHLPTQRSPFTMGGAFTSPPTYTGTLRLPAFMPLQVYSGATTVGTAMKVYLDPGHPIAALRTHLPGTYISPLSQTRLLNELAKAFISTVPPEYRSRVASIGGAGGVTYRGAVDEFEGELGFTGLGSVITTSGGGALGVSGEVEVSKEGEEEKRELKSVFAGATAIAVPVGRFMGKDVGITSLIAGYEFAQETHNALVNGISSQWDPENPSQILVAVNREEDIEDKAVMTARYFYMDKEGTVFEFKGGENDFVEALNFLAAFANEQFMTPTTYAMNVEPTIERGGGALVIDIGKTAWLTHFQELPFIVPEGEPQPLLMQWTAGGAGTVTEEEAKETDVYKIIAPGTMLRLKKDTDGKSIEDYVVQDVEFMMREIEGKNAWELTIGGGVAYAAKEKEREVVEEEAGVEKAYRLRAEEEKLRYRAGVFLRVQKPAYSAGGGVFYEAVPNLKALALFQQSEDMKNYIEGMHRIGVTAYGSAEAGDRLVLGALAHVVPQLKEDMESEEVSYDQTFYRLVGLMRGLKEVSKKTDWGIKVGVSRTAGFDQLMMDYEELGRDVGRDPQRAATMIDNFKEKYGEDLKRVFDYYSLGIVINRNFSLEVTFVAKEEEEKWTEQVPETIYAKSLFTWRTGFWRAFASVPLLSTFGLAEGAEKIGMIGSGIGTDLLDEIFLQRAAADAGMLLARHETGDETWMKAGFFTQGAIRVFSNIIEDSSRYRKLQENDARYRFAISQGRFSSIPKDVRDAICFGLRKEFPEEIRKKIENGEDVALNVDQRNEVEMALWDNWFYEQKFTIEDKFNGNMRAFLAANGYFFDDRTYWDVGTFMEYVDDLRGVNVKGYIIGAQREKLGVFGGVDYEIGRWRGGVVAGVTADGKFGAAASISLRIEGRVLPIEIGVSGFGRSDVIPSYSMPVYRAYEWRGVPEFSVIFFVTIGQGREALRLPTYIPTERYDFSR